MPLSQALGLHPGVAIVTVAVDCMLTALDITIALWPASCLVAVVLAWPVYTMQKNAYGDDDRTARAKAILVALLTAIPTPLPGFLTVGGGIIGGARMLFGGKSAHR